MQRKKIIAIGMVVGSIAGGYVPSFFGIGSFSFTALITSAIGGVVGIYLGYLITK